MAKSLAQQLKAIENRINNEIQDVMDREVKSSVEKVAKEHVQKDVYNKYKPKYYRRTGKLKNEWEIRVDNDGSMLIHNPREDNGKYIPKVIESGEMLGYSKPRPFMSNLKRELQSGNLIQSELKKGLKKRGLKIK